MRFAVRARHQLGHILALGRRRAPACIVTVSYKRSTIHFRSVVQMLCCYIRVMGPIIGRT